MTDLPSRKRPAADPPAANAADGAPSSALYGRLLSILAKALQTSRDKLANDAPQTIQDVYGINFTLIDEETLVALLLGKLDAVHDAFRGDDTNQASKRAAGPTPLEALLQKQDILPVLQKLEAAIADVEHEEREFHEAEEADKQSAREAIKLAKSTTVSPTTGKKRRVLPAETIGYHAYQLKLKYRQSLAKELEEVEKENARLEGALQDKWGEWQGGVEGVKGALATLDTLAGGSGN